MKRLLKVFLSLVMMMGLTACSSTSEQKETADKFMNALQNGQMEIVKSMCVNSEDIAFFKDLDKMTEILTDEKTTGLEFATKAKTSVKNFYKNMISNYKIKSVKENTDNYEVLINITTLDTKDISTKEFETKITNLVLDYVKDNTKTLEDIYKSKGQTAMEHAIYAGAADNILKEFDTLFNNCPKQKGNLTLVLVATDKGYLIADIK